MGALELAPQRHPISGILTPGMPERGPRSEPIACGGPKEWAPQRKPIKCRSGYEPWSQRLAGTKKVVRAALELCSGAGAERAGLAHNRAPRRTPENRSGSPGAWPARARTYSSVAWSAPTLIQLGAVLGGVPRKGASQRTPAHAPEKGGLCAKSTTQRGA